MENHLGWSCVLSSEVIVKTTYYSQPPTVIHPWAEQAIILLQSNAEVKGISTVRRSPMLRTDFKDPWSLTHKTLGDETEQQFGNGSLFLFILFLDPWVHRPEQKIHSWKGSQDMDWSPVLEILSLRCCGQPKWVCSRCAIWCVGLDLQRKSRSKPSRTYVAVNGTLFLSAVAGWWGPAERSVEGILEAVWLSWSLRE